MEDALLAWAEQVRTTLADRPRVTGLPRAAGVAPGVWLRWAWRRLDGVRPALHELPAGLSPAALARHLSRGDVAHLASDTSDATRTTLVALGVHVFDDDAASAEVSLSAASRRALLSEDVHHASLSDRALDAARHALEVHASAGGPVTLVGEASSGRAALAEAVRGTRPWVLVTDADQDPAAATRLPSLRRRPPPRLPPTTRPDHPAFADILGTSDALAAVLEEALQIAPTPLPVLVTGEPGVGKDGLARAVHDASARSGPFEAIDLAALPDDLAHSALFGHVRGAFTGAETDRPGLFRRAEGGTVFLDEVGNLSPALQRALLRVLQQREVLPLGADRAVPVDIRVIAATNADLDDEVAQGRFRADLRDRLAGARLHLPPLRDRGEDVRCLAEAFLTRNRPGARWTPDAITRLEAHAWPGNIRELENVVTRAAVRPETTLDVSALARALPATTGPVVATVRTLARPTHLPAEVWHALTTTQVQVPPLRERPRATLAHRVRHALRGQLVTTGAMSLLCRHPWWGNLDELASVCSRLTGPAIVDEPLVRTVLPTSARSRSTLQVVLFATADGDTVRGFEQRVDRPALLLGRYGGFDELERAPGPRAAAWRRDIARWTPAAPACLPLSWLPGASRVQGLVTHHRGQLRVHAFADSALTLRVAPLQGPPSRVGPGEHRDVGEATELTLHRPDGTEAVHLLLFLGDLARADHQERAARRLRGRGVATSATQLTRVAPLPKPSPHRDQRVWVLSEAECTALHVLCRSYPGGPMSRWIRTQAAAWSNDPALARLSDWLGHAPRPTQYLSRLLSTPGNRLDLTAEVRTRLPRSVQRSVGIVSGSQHD